MGLEPTTAAMARRYSSQLSYAREDWYEGILYIFLKNQEFFISFAIFISSHIIHHVYRPSYFRRRSFLKIIFFGETSDIYFYSLFLFV